MQYCSLQHRTLLPSLVISTTGHCFCFGSVSQFFRELFLHSSPVASLVVAQRVKRLPAMQETWVRSLGQEDPLEKEMATHSSTFAWKIPWMEEPVGDSPWGCKESDMTEQLHSLIHYPHEFRALWKQPGEQ